MKKTLQQGFTLIELLVVVAIIGILASLVIASVNQARTRGVDAAIKATMSSMRAQAELVYDSTGGYSSVCNEDGDLWRLIEDVEEKNGAENDVQCEPGSSSWAILSPLVSNSTENFCVDHTGYAGNASSIVNSTCQVSE